MYIYNLLTALKERKKKQYYTAFLWSLVYDLEFQPRSLLQHCTKDQIDHFNSYNFLPFKLKLACLTCKKNLTPEPLTQSKPRTHISYCCQMWSRLNNLDQIPEIKRQLTLYGELKYTQYTWCTQLFFFSLHILCRRFLWYGSFDFFKIFREDASPSEVYRGDSF